MTENIIYEHATGSSTKKFISSIKEYDKKIDMGIVKKYIDELLLSSIITLTEEDEKLLRTFRETL